MPDDEDITIGEIFKREGKNVIDDSLVVCESCRWIGHISETIPLETIADEEGFAGQIRLGCPRCRSDVDLLESSQ